MKQGRSDEHLREGTSSEIDVLGAQHLQAEGAQLIDVRERSEFLSSHARGAYNIPLGELPQRLGDIHRDGMVLLICQSGQRSKTAHRLLTQEHISDVRSVLGGTKAWRDSGLPMEEQNGKGVHPGL